MQKIKIQTQWSHKLIPEKPNTGKSMTVPDQTMSIREILQRFARGQSLGGTAQEGQYYDGDEKDIDTMELTDRMDYIAKKGKEYQELNKKQKDEAENAYKRKIIEEYEKSKPTT